MKKPLLRVGVIGTGAMGREHIRGFRKVPGCEVAAACDVAKENLRKAAEEFKIQHLYTDYRTMLRKERLDAVAIATPNLFHKPSTIAALKAGCHVLCEKPMATNVRDAEAMVAEARKARRTLMINFSFLFEPSTLALRRVVAAGEIGAPSFVRTAWMRRWGIPGWGGWFGQKRLAGGGPLIDLGVHRIAIALFLIGDVEPVSASGATFFQYTAGERRRAKAPLDVEDLATGFVRFRGGAVMLVAASWASPIAEEEYMYTSVMGDKGGILQYNVDGGYKFRAEMHARRHGSFVTTAIGDPSVKTPTAWGHFVDCITTGRTPISNAALGLRVQKVVAALYESARQRREVLIK